MEYTKKQEKNKLSYEFNLTNEWTKIIEKHKKEFAKNIAIEGFRKGKAPLKEAEKHINYEKLFHTATNEIVELAKKELVNSKDDEAKKLLEDYSILQSVAVKAIDLEKIEFAISFFTSPKIEKLEKYDDINLYGISEDTLKGIEEERKERIKQATNKIEIIEVKKEKLEKDDIALFDFTGFIDDKPFPGGEAKDYELKIGSGLFIPGFEDQMVGMKVGEDKTIDVKFPDDYSPEFKGKDAKFKLHLTSIKNEKITPITKEMKEEYEQLEANVKTINQQSDALLDIIWLDNNQSLINKELIKRAKISSDIADDYLTVGADDLIQRIHQNLINQKMAAKDSDPYKTLCDIQKISKEELINKTKEIFLDNAKFEAIIKQIYESQNPKIEASDCYYFSAISSGNIYQALGMKITDEILEQAKNIKELQKIATLRYIINLNKKNPTQKLPKQENHEHKCCCDDDCCSK